MGPHPLPAASIRPSGEYIRQLTSRDPFSPNGSSMTRSCLPVFRPRNSSVGPVVMVPSWASASTLPSGERARNQLIPTPSHFFSCQGPAPPAWGPRGSQLMPTPSHFFSCWPFLVSYSARRGGPPPALLP